MAEPPVPAANGLSLQLLLEMDAGIRASLNGIIGMMELLLDTPLVPQQQEYLTLGQASADALLSAVNNLVTAAKIEAEQLEPDAIPFSLRDSLGYTAGGLAVRIGNRRLQLVVHVLENVPDALVGDPGILRRIVENLVEHAARRAAGGVLLLKVEQAWDTADTIQLDFSLTRRDTGARSERGAAAAPPGAPPDAASPLLTITGRLVQALGGELSIGPRQGQDARVLFTIAYGRQRGPLDLPRPASCAALRRLPVLVADDEPLHRHVLEQTLLQWGMRPSAAESGAEALRLLERSAAGGAAFPLVLLSGSMPGLDGLEVAAQIRQRPALSGVRVVVLALSGRRGDAARCRELGVTAYLTRPVKRADLYDALLTVLGMPTGVPTPFLVTRHSLREGARSMRVLVLDGRAEDRKRLAESLEVDGETVLAARSPEEAREAFEQQPIGVVFVERGWRGLSMPRVIALARKRAQGEVPIFVAVAGRWPAAARRQARQAGVHSCLARPLQRAKLRGVIAAVRAARQPLTPQEAGKRRHLRRRQASRG